MLSRAIIFFSLYLIFTNSIAAEKSKIIKKLNSIDNINFNFTQKTNEKVEVPEKKTVHFKMSKKWFKDLNNE